MTSTAQGSGHDAYDALVSLAACARRSAINSSRYVSKTGTQAFFRIFTAFSAMLSRTLQHHDHTPAQT
ncbi:MAG TPA: hypothetical protein ENK05_07665 [Gammaproteobacteria bacterium]|nr:hypothetical protein [Gammaproteobacteria bacterium]